jgi:hypothetical protein
MATQLWIERRSSSLRFMSKPPRDEASSFPPLGETKTDSCNLPWPCPCGMTVKLLIDECLHTSLVEVAHAAGHLADHVNYLGLGSSKDWQLMATIRQQDFEGGASEPKRAHSTFNRSALGFSRAPLPTRREISLLFA